MTNEKIQTEEVKYDEDGNIIVAENVKLVFTGEISPDFTE